MYACKQWDMTHAQKSVSSASDFARDPCTRHTHPPRFDRSPRALTRINRMASACGRPQLLKLQILRSVTCEVC